MGLVGTRPADGKVLLVGDAAGLVNPLQGEGIAQALESGRAAAIVDLEPARRRGGWLPPVGRRDLRPMDVGHRPDPRQPSSAALGSSPVCRQR